MTVVKKVLGIAVSLALCVTGVGSACAQASDPAALDALNVWGLPQTQCERSDLLREGGVSEQVGDVTVSIDQVAYDGVTAYVRYSLKDATLNQPLAELDKETGMYLLTDEAYNHFAEKKTGWFADSIWVNGEEYSMPSASSYDFGSAENGEMITYLSIRLDETGTVPGEEMTLGLPIGNPEAENKGIITAKLDGSVAKRMREETFGERLDLDEISVTQVKTTVTPLKLYVSATIQVDADACIAQREKEQAEMDAQEMPIVVDDQWAGASLCSKWAADVLPVNAQGEIIEGMLEGVLGMYSAGATEACFEYLICEDMPEEIYLAQCDENGKVIDMEKALRIL